MLALESISSDSAIGRLRAVEVRQLLLGAVLEHREIFLREVGDVSALRIAHRHIERDNLDARAKDLRFLGRQLWRGGLFLWCRRRRDQRLRLLHALTGDASNNATAVTRG